MKIEDPKCHSQHLAQPNKYILKTKQTKQLIPLTQQRQSEESNLGNTHRKMLVADYPWWEGKLEDNPHAYYQNQAAVI